jgi:hypothetical protein
VCGACGTSTRRDEWSEPLASRRARWEAAKVVNEVLAGQRHPARVSCGPAGWVVRSGTGAAVVADTVREVWDAVRSVRDLDPVTGQSLGSTSSVVAAVLESATATAAAGSRRHAPGGKG